MRRDEQIHNLSLAMEAAEQCLEHLRQVHGPDGGDHSGGAIVAIITAQAMIHRVMDAMVGEEITS